MSGEEIRKAQEKAWDEGAIHAFSHSGEGWNGEYPFDDGKDPQLHTRSHEGQPIQAGGGSMSRAKQRACAIEDIRHRVPDQVIAMKYGWFPAQIHDIKDHIDRYGGYEEGPEL